MCVFACESAVCVCVCVCVCLRVRVLCVCVSPTVTHARARCNPPATSLLIMANGGGQGLLSREVPSVALDQLFLELHEQLPAEARGKLAQLASR